MNESQWFSSAVVVAPLLLMAIVFWSTAKTRRGVLFGVSVSIDFASSTEAKRFIGTYRTRILLSTIGCAVLCLPPCLRVAAWLPVVATPSLIATHLFFWQLARRRLKDHELTVPIERRATVSFDSDLGALWMVPLAASFVPLAVTWLHLQKHWAEVPVRFPVHWNLAGVADRWMLRSPLAVAMPLLIAAGIIAFMLFVAGFMRLVAVADRQRAVRTMFPVLTVFAWVIVANLCWVALLPLQPRPQPAAIAVAALGTLGVVAGVVVWMIWRLMQTQGTDAYDGTPDSGWRAGGLVYYNPADAAVMVPQRIGWGWTFNFARRAAWWYCGTVGLLIAAIALVPLLLR